MNLNPYMVQIMPLFLDYSVFSKCMSYGKTLDLQENENMQKDTTFTFKTKELPYQAGIDFYNYLIDRIPKDNVRQLEE